MTSTVSFVVRDGYSTVTWDTDSAGGFALDFFGLTNAEGAWIHGIPAEKRSPTVPEPGTAVLLGGGLILLAGARRGQR